MGVGSPAAPAENCRFIVRTSPAIAPANVPLLLRWHALQEPSSGSGARVCTVPETCVPFCERGQVTTFVPCESTLLPLHSPATLGGFDGMLSDPQATTTTVTAAMATRRRTSRVLCTQTRQT